MNTMQEANVASEINAIFADEKKPRRRKFRFPRISRKPVIVDRWWE